MDLCILCKESIRKNSEGRNWQRVSYILDSIIYILDSFSTSLFSLDFFILFRLFNYNYYILKKIELLLILNFRLKLPV